MYRKINFLVVSCVISTAGVIASATADEIRPQVQWIRQIGSPKNDQTKGITIDLTGAIYVAGETEGDLFGDSEQGDFLLKSV
jgi:hypothetical protein